MFVMTNRSGMTFNYVNKIFVCPVFIEYEVEYTQQVQQ